MRVVVVGAGLGGVAAAVALHRGGHEVTLYERGAELREAGTAVVIAPNGVRALEALGAQDAVRGRGLPGGSGGLRDRRGRPLLVTDLAPAQRQIGTMAVVHRTELHQQLRAPLPAERVRTGMPVERLESDPAGVTVISGGTAVRRADAVIVADGIGSTLRGRLFPGHPGVRRAGRLDLRGVLPRPTGLDVAGILAGMLVDRRTGAMFGLFPLGEDHLYWYTDSALSETPTDPGEARLAMLSLMADWHPAVPAVIEATRPADIYADAIARLAEPLPSFALGRVALLGDAAHAMTPDLGQGASQVFEDAAALSRHMAGAEPAAAAERLRRYDAERRPRANRMIAASARQGRLTALTGGTAWLRDTLLRAVPARFAARRLAAIWQL
ncbi:2-polyprenyl-6-methoxyphenol hydroxylase-like FAD-dependent oxidoreductase [Murinocardiopsis flavida]|uniref:2-polyprenyl-6-methoxyphenol hydroxylase-like FAD-dependent oxidoreductase n=1 Tax=Murinocardiopsis flavida TaxID=645275 RepID=A0A2P8CF31_9ACTN|nr:FAD-dependent monooxygenase [Murinocardiopsis flavida]PSK83585.1 2-polyprenyl-6-methoxyphenol hydroxylase-like FAD-dependent oxidoreductase [Murinocardiopsis flavida]